MQTWSSTRSAIPSSLLRVDQQAKNRSSPRMAPARIQTLHQRLLGLGDSEHGWTAGLPRFRQREQYHQKSQAALGVQVPIIDPEPMVAVLHHRGDLIRGWLCSRRTHTKAEGGTQVRGCPGGSHPGCTSLRDVRIGDLRGGLRDDFHHRPRQHGDLFVTCCHRSNTELEFFRIRTEVKQLPHLPGSSGFGLVQLVSPETHYGAGGTRLLFHSQSELIRRLELPQHWQSLPGCAADLGSDGFARDNQLDATVLLTSGSRPVVRYRRRFPKPDRRDGCFRHTLADQKGLDRLGTLLRERLVEGLRTDVVGVPL